ncbi:lysine N(6)-hydroxylase/L-ornithine N(5)-oxygenase family protein [Acinetobacter ursingii]|uniref:SidA/IucD/PvdA family monooxygenase n=1 Tax=Acinetobacter ursingii TaxID=108980 RepID=A0AA46S5E6_9GAMM|nr:SidA/IucD/PvdA family monooxygenase [Acinetobacter ursingii]UYF72403.1 SidA/IucD/PvdA family monooxygenase [Acinetobacter ursingii]
MLDFIGIGLGPFNLSLASLLQDKTKLNYLFFEQKDQFDWHAGMQLPNTMLQVPFMADLVSMVDPTSPYSFLNYLKHQQRLYKFYFLEQSHIPRREYNQYCQWVAAQLDHIQYQSKVVGIEALASGFQVTVEQHGVKQHYRCKQLVIGTGHVPHLPACLSAIAEIRPEQCLHSAHYLFKNKVDLNGNVVVLGSGQSAAEVFLDLFELQNNRPDQNVELHWFTRSSGFFPMEYAPLGLEHFSPDYLQHFYQLDEKVKSSQLAQQALLYKGISAKTIREIYHKLYQRSISGQPFATHLHNSCELIDATSLTNGQIRLHFVHKTTQQAFYLDADHVIVATGYRTPQLSFMEKISSLIERDSKHRWKITQDYQLVHSACGNIFVQNQEMHSHGVGTPDLGLGAYRSAVIANQLTQQTLYELGDQPQTFQHFDLSQNPNIQFTHSVTNTVETCQEKSDHRGVEVSQYRRPSNHLLHLQRNKSKLKQVLSHVFQYEKSL